MAQEQDDFQTDRWRGLILNESSPEDAIRILGQPKTDEVRPFFNTPVDNWLTQRRTEKIFRALIFKKVKGVDQVSLAFLEGKLVMIALKLKRLIVPDALPDVYAISFIPVTKASQLAPRPQDFTGKQEKRVRRTFYPDVYNLIGVSERSLIIGMVSVPRIVTGGPDAEDFDNHKHWPGNVGFILLISRTLEKADSTGGQK